MLGRRAFLGGAIAAAGLAACGGSSGAGDGVKATTTTAPSLGPTTTVHAAKLAKDPFTLGVASGDPTADSLVLWTRLAPALGAADGMGGMPAGKSTTRKRHSQAIERSAASA